MRRTVTVILICFAAVACSASHEILDEYEPVPAATVIAAPMPAKRIASEDAEAVSRGRYLVGLLGCGACHTDGALLGSPRADRLLAGSRIGLAHSNPLEVENPAVVFAANLTPDPDTGIGDYSDWELARAIRAGVGKHGTRTIKVMPIAGYAWLRDEDVKAIVTYLRHLPSVRHQVPDAVSEGTPTSHQFVHFGVYIRRARQ